MYLDLCLALILLPSSIFAIGTPKIRSEKEWLQLGDAGIKRAEIFNGCLHAWWANDERSDNRLSQYDKHYRDLLTHHSTNCMSSKKFKLLFVDNVKAGSTTVQAKLKNGLGLQWFGGLPESTVPNCKVSHLKRMGTKCVRAEEALDRFVFSYSRDPVSKFESGVRQAWAQHPESFSNISADELLDTLLDEDITSASIKSRGMTGMFLNEHLQPTTYRLSGGFANGSRPHFNFIGELASFDADWEYIVRQGFVDSLTTSQIKNLLKPAGHSNHRDSHISKHGKASTLSDDSVRRMCRSKLYREEWRCLGYDLPDVCK